MVLSIPGNGTTWFWPQEEKFFKCFFRIVVLFSISQWVIQVISLQTIRKRKTVCRWSNSEIKKIVWTKNIFIRTKRSSKLRTKLLTKSDSHGLKIQGAGYGMFFQKLWVGDPWCKKFHVVLCFIQFLTFY